MTERHTFYDELGNQIEFVVKAKFSMDDTEYIALLPANEIDAMTYILRIEMNEEGEEILVGIDNDELEEVKDIYEELVKENLQ